MFRVFSVAVYDFVQKRTKNPKLRTLYYFLVMGLIWGLFTFAIGALGQLRDFLAGEIEQELYFKVITFLPLAGFILGDLFGLIPWLLWFRHDADIK